MKKGRIWAIIIAVLAIALVAYVIVRETNLGSSSAKDLVNYEYMPAGTLEDLVGEDVYSVVMDMVKFIKSEKFIHADFESNYGDTQLSLGDDYAVLADFDKLYNEHIISVASDVSSAESDTQYLLQTVGAALSSQIQQKALMMQKNEIEAEPAKWTHLDMSELDDVIATYGEIALEAIETVEAENMKAIKAYFIEQPWNKKLKYYSNYLATFNEGLSKYD